MSDETRKLELKIQSLKERFSKKVADYEDEIAELRVDATLMFESMTQRINDLEKERNEQNVQSIPSDE